MNPSTRSGFMAVNVGPADGQTFHEPRATKAHARPGEGTRPTVFYSNVVALVATSHALARTCGFVPKSLRRERLRLTNQSEQMKSTR